MKSIFLYNLRSILAILLSGLMLSLSSCEDRINDPVESEQGNDELTISGSLSYSTMQNIVSRALGATQGNGMKLTILEFDKGSDDSHSFLRNIYQATITETSTSGKETINFKFTLKAATNAKELHFFVTDSYITPDYGSVASIIPSITVGRPGNETEAYWGRLVFPDGYTDTADPESTPQFLDGVKEKFKDVPIIRNFARISLELSETAKGKLDLFGFALVNVPTSGTIAPWNQAKNEVPNLLTNSGMKSYEKIIDEEGYRGIVPGQASFRNIEAEMTLPESGFLSNSTKYIYEHPYESSRRTYLIVQGRYKPTNATVYYKLDIGNYSADGKFDFYDIIRNIDYKITIDDVLAPGTATIEDAIDRAPFNNLSAATETSSMLNISDGQNMLIVNDTNHIIITKDQTIDILYRYMTNIGKINETTDNSIPVVRISEGDVIESYQLMNVDETDDDNVTWRRIKITPQTPTSVVKTQSITITDNNGLARTINLVLRTPWQYSVLYSEGGRDYYATIAPGIEQTYTSVRPQPISANAGESLTVYFNLPNGLPEAMFPLEFQLEAKYQGIENNKIGSLVVSTGPSLFDPNVTSISYIKTVSYQEYEYLYVNNESNDINPNAPNTRHTVRCRFLTIIDEEVSDAQILIHNDYFIPDASVIFSRK